MRVLFWSFEIQVLSLNSPLLFTEYLICDIKIEYMESMQFASPEKGAPSPDIPPKSAHDLYTLARFIQKAWAKRQDRSRNPAKADKARLHLEDALRSSRTLIDTYNRMMECEPEALDSLPEAARDLLEYEVGIAPHLLRKYSALPPTPPEGIAVRPPQRPSRSSPPSEWHWPDSY